MSTTRRENQRENLPSPPPSPPQPCGRGGKEGGHWQEIGSQTAFPRIFKDRLRPHRTLQEAECSSNLCTLSPGNPIPGCSLSLSLSPPFFKKRGRGGEGGGLLKRKDNSSQGSSRRLRVHLCCHTSIQTSWYRNINRFPFRWVGHQKKKKKKISFFSFFFFLVQALKRGYPIS